MVPNLHLNTLQHTATHGNTPNKLQFVERYFRITLQHTAPHCNTLHHTATHCNTLQHTATPGGLHVTNELQFVECCFRITLQHDSTHCNTIQHLVGCAARTSCSSWSAASESTRLIATEPNSENPINSILLLGFVYIHICIHACIHIHTCQNIHTCK